MRAHRLASARAAMLLVGLAAAGCSLVNAFDDVTPEPAGQYAGGSAPKITDAADASVAADAAPLPERPGVIVVGGAVGEADAPEGRTFVLTALDPTNGKELAPGKREKMAVAAVRYDGLRDLWFIFESGGADFVPSPMDSMTLHVRSLDTSTGTWTELSKVQLPPLQSYDSIAVLRERIGYVAYTQNDAAPSEVQFVVVDTSNPRAVSVLSKAVLARTPFGITESRSVTGTGGQVNMVQVDTGSCEAGLCPLQLLGVRVPNGTAEAVVEPTVDVAYTSRFAIPSYASLLAADRTLVVTPRAANTAASPTTLSLFEPRNKTPDGTDVTAILTDSVVRRAAIAECERVAFLIGANGDLDLHAVPLPASGTGTPAKAPLGHSGQSVYYEPTTRTVIAPFNQGAGFAFTAYKLGGTPIAPTLTLREPPDWTPPDDLRPNLLGIKLPLPIVCQ